MILRAAVLLGVAVGLILAACGDDKEDVLPAPSETPPPAVTQIPDDTSTSPTVASTPTPDPRPAAVAAIDALGTWLGPIGERPAISVVSVEAVTWSNGCLDLARANQACTEALVEGFRIELALGDAFYAVRTDLGGDVVVWAPNLRVVVSFQEAMTNSVLFTTDDGGTVEAEPVPGTGYGVDLTSLAAGDPVDVGLADTPERDGFLLVWVDPVP